MPQSRQREREPDPATVFSWRRVYLKLELHTQALWWFSTLNKSRTQGMQPELCTHSDASQLRNSANKFASQTFCNKCQKTIVFNHTREGVISWMATFQKLIAKNKISPPAGWTYGDAFHPEDEGASRYCRRCVHHMEPIQNASGCRTWHQCSQHSATPPCNYARNGHTPPTDQSKAKQEKNLYAKKRLWLDHNTVITPDHTRISGTTVNKIGKSHKDKTYMEIFETAPLYVAWAITTAPPASEASIELKHMASFFLEASKRKEAFQNEPDSSSPASSSINKQPTGKSSFVKPKAKSKANQSKTPHYDMAAVDEETDEEM
jgi:hypothetical protein